MMTINTRKIPPAIITYLLPVDKFSRMVNPTTTRLTFVNLNRIPVGIVRIETKPIIWSNMDMTRQKK